MHITLRANEKIYINGAVLKVDRKCSIELMNDAVFLLEAHVMLEQDAKTLLRQLYFIVQTMLMEPGDLQTNQTMFHQQCVALATAYQDLRLLEGLVKVAALVEKRRHFDALKLIRTLVPIEDAILDPAPMPMLAEAS